MKIGISTATYFEKLPTEETFPYIKAAGADVAEVFMNTFSEYTPEFGRILKKNADNAGVAVYSVHASNLNYEPNLNNPTRRAPRSSFKRKIAEREILYVSRRHAA